MPRRHEPAWAATGGARGEAPFMLPLASDRELDDYDYDLAYCIDADCSGGLHYRRIRSVVA
jgi:hypothetical protein